MLITTLIPSCVRSDCGCNKVEREPIEIVKREISSDENIQTEPVIDNKVSTCSSQNPSESQLLKSIHYAEADDDAMSLIPSGEYAVGTNEAIIPSDRESPERIAQIDEFFIDKYEVSNRQFLDFVTKTGYQTEAEKFGDSFIFSELLTPEIREKFHDYRVVNAPWWYKINGTDWKHPEGPASSIVDRMNHPVVHVSWNDAVEFCKWKEKRLPTEDEWEVACRGGKKRKLFPWGNKLDAKDMHW